MIAVAWWLVPAARSGAWQALDPAAQQSFRGGEDCWVDSTAFCGSKNEDEICTSCTESDPELRLATCDNQGKSYIQTPIPCYDKVRPFDPEEDLLGRTGYSTKTFYCWRKSTCEIQCSYMGNLGGGNLYRCEEDVWYENPKDASKTKWEYGSCYCPPQGS